MPDSIESISQLELWIKEARSWFVPDCAKTITILLPAIVLAKAQHETQQEIEALLLLALSYWALGQLADAHLALDRVETLKRISKDPRHAAEYDNARARLLLAASEYGPALKLWSSCLKKALSLQAFDLYVQACLGIGNIFTAHQQHGNALRWHETALEFARKVSDHELLAESFLHVAADLNHLGEYELTLVLSKQGEPVFLTSRHKAWLADWYSYRGDAHMALKQYHQAQGWLQAAWDLNQNLNYLWSQSINLMALGRVYMAQQRFVEAEHYLLLALKTILSFASNVLLLRVYNLLAELGQAKDDYKMAWENRHHYHRLAISDVQQMAKEKLTSALERRIKDLDTQLFVLQTRQENLLLRQKSSADSELLNTLRSASLQDPLTGLSNRRHLDQEMPLMYQRCIEEQRAFTTLMLDLDHFKSINDQFGHPIGDEVIRTIAAILLQSCRGGDLVARFGGEEFVLLLPGAMGSTAVEVSERIRKRIEEFNWVQFHAELKVTSSIGVAEQIDEPDAKTLLEHADQALYQAKHNGRNRVELYQ
ncbi:GGDEF domain-containing protein [Deefgea rivuli]|uniref:GGDEF domain-containing protein n=1 Tax=Deefgea rivuli TaxID=400948 RepID=UPI0004836E27|nr:diguanylate cyclase [Deefgea rivuli]